MNDRYSGKIGTDKRDEYELRLDQLGEVMERLRKERHLIQTESGEITGAQKSQISQMERNAKNVTIETILRVFKELNAKVNFNV